MKTKKGQVALESIFVVLFIVVAIAQILALVTAYSNDIGNMANVRAQLQGYALERSLEGTTTYLIRVNPDVSRSTSHVTAYFVSEDCSGILADVVAFGNIDDVKCNMNGKGLFEY